jgi:hypothetical protein
VSNRGLDGPGSPAEVTAEAVAEVQESLTNPGQQSHPGVSRRVFLTLPAVLFMRYLIKPCLLIRDGLSQFVNNNQIDEFDKVEVVDAGFSRNGSAVFELVFCNPQGYGAPEKTYFCNQ